MTRQVLVALDGSEQSWAALDHALTEIEDCEVTALHVINPIEAGFSVQAGAIGAAEGWYETAKDSAEELFEEARSRAEDERVPLRTAIEHGRPSRVIVEYAEDEEMDQIVLGSHGRSGVSRILLGSVAEQVVRRSPVPVTVVR